MTALSRITALIAAALFVGTPNLRAQADKPEMKDIKDKASYALGVNVGNAWKRQEIEVNVDLVARGLKDALAGSDLALSEAELRDVMNQFRTEMTAKVETKKKAASEKNGKEGADFLAKNKTADGVVTLPSGLQYKAIKMGEGPKPALKDTVETHYRGTLIDGTEFDSSYKRGEPATFPLTGVIKGWTEALQLMPVGSKWQLYLPSELAYGDNGAGGTIGPNAVLIFDIELLTIKPPPAPAQPVTSDIIKVPSAEELKKGAKIEVIKPEDLKKQQQQP